MNGNSPYVNTALAQTSAPTPPTNTITPLSMDPSDAGLRVHVQNGSTVGVGVADESAFVEGTTKFNGAGGVFNDSLTAISSGLVAWFRMTAYRAVHVNLRNNSGTEIGTLANPVRTDTTGTTNQPVTQATASNLNAQVVGSTASGASLTSNPVTIGALAKTSLPTAVSDAQVVNKMADKFGRGVAIVGTIRDLVGTQYTTLSNTTSETTIITAASGVFNDLVAVFVVNTSAATNTRIDFRDDTAGSIIFSLYSVAGLPPIGFSLTRPIPQTAVNKNWTAQCVSATTDVRIFCEFEKNK